jgi:hypothetical protein
MYFKLHPTLVLIRTMMQYGKMISAHAKMLRVPAGVERRQVVALIFSEIAIPTSDMVGAASIVLDVRDCSPQEDIDELVRYPLIRIRARLSTLAPAPRQTLTTRTRPSQFARQKR